MTGQLFISAFLSFFLYFVLFYSLEQGIRIATVIIVEHKHQSNHWQSERVRPGNGLGVLHRTGGLLFPC